MTKDGLARFKKRIQTFLKGNSLSHEAEDFTSYALLKYSEGVTSPIYQLWTHYVRENYGDLRTEYRKKQNRTHSQSVTPFSPFVDPKGADHNVDFGFVLRFLSEDGEWFSQRDRTALVLKYEWGASQSEIAYMFGVSDAMVSKIFEEIEDRIRHMLSAQLDGMD